MGPSQPIVRFLGWGAVVTATALVVLIVVTAVTANTVSGIGSLVLLIVCPGLLWPWVWMQNRKAQTQAVATGQHLAIPESPGSAVVVRLPNASSGVPLIMRHPAAAAAAASVVPVLGIAGVALVVIAVGFFPLGAVNDLLPSDAFPYFAFRLGLVLAVVAVAWAIIFKSVFLTSEDVVTILASRPAALGWGQTTTPGLRGFIEASEPKLAKGALRKKGYVVVTSAGLEFWQRDGKSLERVFTIRRAAVHQVEKGTVSYALQVLNGVILHVDGAPGATQEVPLLVQGVGGWRAATRAPAEFVEGWKTTAG